MDVFVVLVVVVAPAPAPAAAVSAVKYCCAVTNDGKEKEYLEAVSVVMGVSEDTVDAHVDVDVEGDETGAAAAAVDGDVEADGDAADRPKSEKGS